MFALHAVWRADRCLALWAEAENALLPPPQVAELIGGTGPGLEWLMTKAAEGETTLLLPTQNGALLPSPELGRPVDGPRRAVTLDPWQVPSLLLEPGEAAQLLGELYAPGKPFLPTQLPAEGPVDVPYGASLRWLTAVHDLAWRMVGRGQVLPGLTMEDGRPYARWRPAPDADGWRETRELTAAIPPVARAERSGGHPDGRAAGELVADLLEVLVDCEARAVLEDEPPLLRPGRARRPDGAAEAWVSALSTADARVGAQDAGPVAGPVAALGERLTAWHRSESPAGEGGPLRVCFRLREPQGLELDDWRLEFLLQAADEPSLMVAADALWEPGPALSTLERKTPRPADALHDGLVRASRLWPPLREALRSARPAALGLDRAGALAFLRDAGPALTAAGYAVLLPSWWQRPARFGLTLTARAVQPGLVHDRSLLDRDRIVDFRWRAAIGDAPLTEAELTELAAAKQPLVRLRGQWTEVDPARIAAVLAFLERRGSGTMAAGEVLRVALEPDATAGGLPVSRVSADGLLGGLLSGSAEPQPVPLPGGFGAVLRPYQERGLAWLAFMTRLGLGAVLADDMGLGKTVQTLALLAAEHAEGAGGPNLLVCPMSVVGNWQREAARFAPMLRVYVHHGPQRLAGDALRQAAPAADLVITTYGLAERDAEALRAVHWRRVVADEAQHIKNSATRQARAVRSLPAAHRIALTGTPVENRLAELHAVLDFANPGLFGSAARFKERHSIPIERDGDSAAAAALQRRTRPFVLRRLKNDPAIARDLPEKLEMTVLCGLTTEQAGLYRATVADMLARIAESRGIERKGIVLSTLTKLKQICNHPAQFLHERYDEGAGAAPLTGRSGKLERLEEILAEALAEGDKVLCFTQYAEFGRLLQGHLTRRLGREVLFLHGGVPKAARDTMTARFQESDGPPVFLLSLKAGGTGLNLTAAAHVIHLDRWWNPAVEDQATDRAFRIGQRRNVQVRKFVCAGTIEERIDVMIEAKRNLAGAVVGDGEGWLTDLSTDELRELVELAADAADDDEEPAP